MTKSHLVTCDYGLATQVVNNAGVPYDKIVIIVNNSVYGGSGGEIAVAYNGSYGPQVFVHEFGHSLASLVDEYIVNYEYARLDRNCYAGTPPNPAWAGIVAPSDYYVGCNFDSWYRSSPDSIMRTITTPYFNPISQSYLSQAIDYFTRPLPKYRVWLPLVFKNNY